MPIRTGLSYMGHHNPKHLQADLKDIKSLQCDDVLVAMQENDFVHMVGKVRFTPRIAKDLGIRPIAVFWGALNLFGGGRSSQFLLANPDCHQMKYDGSWNPEGCYSHPKAVQRIFEMLDQSAAAGFEAYLIDEPTLLDCYCESCRALFREWYGGDLKNQHPMLVGQFRRRCCYHYIRTICQYIKKNLPGVETQCVLMPFDDHLWEESAQVKELDNLGTDVYWANTDLDLRYMAPLVRKMADTCKRYGKIHHEFLEAWAIRKANEPRMLEQGRILVREQPDVIWAWAYLGQVGTLESCEDPESAWAIAAKVLRMAKDGE